MTLKTERKNLLFKDEAYAIIGACFAVYRDKGCGFHEAVYQECLEIECDERVVPFIAKPPLTLQYRGRTLAQTFVPDLLCFEKIIVELKALTELADAHRAQVLNYLKASKCELGLLVNFGHYPQLEWERIARSHVPPNMEDLTL